MKKPPFYMRLRFPSVMQHTNRYMLFADAHWSAIIGILLRKHDKHGRIPQTNYRLVMRRRRARYADAIHMRNINLYRSRGHDRDATELFFGI